MIWAKRYKILSTKIPTYPVSTYPVSTYPVSTYPSIDGYAPIALPNIVDIKLIIIIIIIIIIIRTIFMI